MADWAADASGLDEARIALFEIFAVRNQAVYGRMLGSLPDRSITLRHGDNEHGRTRTRAFLTTIPLLLGLASAGPATTAEFKLTAADGAGGDGFGDAVAMSAETVVIGARADADKGFASGSAYFYALDAGGWTLQNKVTASDGAFGDQFGWSVDIDGDSAVIGAYLEDPRGTNSGSAYVFTRTNGVWTEQMKLTAPDGAAGDQFGYAVGISGDTVVVGAIDDDDAGTSSGAAYVFVRSGAVWSYQAKLTASDAGAGDQLGRAVAISGDTVVVGAWHDDDIGADAGAAYVFTRTGSLWSQQEKLLDALGNPGDEFGSSVDVDGDSAVVGAWSADQYACPNCGAAHVFQRIGASWSEQDGLVPTEVITPSDYLGTSVSISGDLVIVGSPGDDHEDNNGVYDLGAAYVFQRSGSSWTEIQRIVASDAAASDSFGDAVGVSGGRVIIGAVGDADAGFGTGSAYVYDGIAGLPVPAISDPAALLTLLALSTGAGLRAARRRGTRRPERGPSASLAPRGP
jgi:hypothetical protein